MTACISLLTKERHTRRLKRVDVPRSRVPVTTGRGAVHRINVRRRARVVPKSCPRAYGAVGVRVEVILSIIRRELHSVRHEGRTLSVDGVAGDATVAADLKLVPGRLVADDDLS